MDISAAKSAVNQILDEERERPTIFYEDMANRWATKHSDMTPEELALHKVALTPRKNLWSQRRVHPRAVTETPQIFQFSGTNFDLLMSVYGRINESERPQLLEYILRRVQSGGTRVYPEPENYDPNFEGKVCELPLIAEFCIRTGSIEQFFAATAKPPMPTPVNWNLFSTATWADSYLACSVARNCPPSDVLFRAVTQQSHRAEQSALQSRS